MLLPESIHARLPAVLLRAGMRAVAIAALLVIVMAVPAPAATAAPPPIRVCTHDIPHPPFSYPDRDGIVQILIRMAAARAGVQVEFRVAPAERCRGELRSGLIDASSLVAYTPENAASFAFPMQNGADNTALSVLRVRALAYRRKGSTASWDGKEFTALRQPVLVPSGFGFLTQRLAAMQVAFDEGGKNLEQNLLKLLAERGDLAILPEADGIRLLRDPRFADRIEALPEPFVDQRFYLAFSRRYHAAHGDAVAELWRAIGTVRQSRDYQEAIRDLR